MSSAREDVFAALERRVGYEFADRSLLKRALTHSSAASKRGGGSYQQLEFLGDRVLALAIADMLLAAFPKASEGELARRLTALVRNETCVAVARELELGEATQLGGGEAQSGGRTKAAILGDVCEALIGALYLDGGAEPARRFIEKHWRSRMLDGDAARPDAKTTLQEWAQGRGLLTPTYAIVKRSGPEHAPRFTSEVKVEGVNPATGEGGSRREAEQQAAAALLHRQGIWKHEET
jgi:ribonuclease-3